MNTGFRLDFPDTWILQSPLFALEFHDLGSIQKRTSLAKRVHFGGETKITRFLSFRAGVNQGYICGGIGIDLPVLKLDFGTYGEELTGIAGELEDRRFMARIAFEI